ncbi:protein argonaute 14-like [Choloepus didactylus]|uniref:protein argonaute 14-like n=1 Tax=Choloepus didactylus TaxID=27675 RepID=UPI00189F214F|nr:protein argonaute 14-like [Choloepus didactylus]
MGRGRASREGAQGRGGGRGGGAGPRGAGAGRGGDAGTRRAAECALQAGSGKYGLQAAPFLWPSSLLSPPLLPSSSLRPPWTWAAAFSPEGRDGGRRSPLAGGGAARARLPRGRMARVGEGTRDAGRKRPTPAPDFATQLFPRLNRQFEMTRRGNSRDPGGSLL